MLNVLWVLQFVLVPEVNREEISIHSSDFGKDRWRYSSAWNEKWPIEL